VTVVPIKTLRPTERCTINGYECEIVRQARRTTFVRIVGPKDPDLVGVTVQLKREQKVSV